MLSRFIYGVFVTLISVVVADGFVQIDFDVIKGADRNEAFHNYREAKRQGKRWLGGDPFSLESSGVAGPSPLIFENSYYASSIQIGSEKDEVVVLLDTGSSDLWVQSSANPLCSEIDCEVFGLYDQNSSTTYHNNGTKFHIGYGDYTFAEGTLGQDDVTLASGITVKGANLAVADLSNSSVGVFGIGFTQNEATLHIYRNNSLYGFTYSNYPIQLKEQGLIDKVSYSLYLTSDNSTGNIIFGGYDTEKYYGELVEFDVIKDGPVYDFFTIQLDSATVTLFNNETGNTKRFFFNTTGEEQPQTLGELPTIDINGPAFLDSGTTYTYLPNGAPGKILDQLQPGAVYDNYYQSYIVSCSLLHSENKLTYSLGNGALSIDIPFEDVIGVDPKNATTGEKVCYYGIFDGNILGDTFIRHVYSVYDLEAKKVYLAPIRHSEWSNIETIH